MIHAAMHFGNLKYYLIVYTSSGYANNLPAETLLTCSGVLKQSWLFYVIALFKMFDLAVCYAQMFLGCS